MKRLTFASEPGISAAMGCGMLCLVYRGAHDSTYPEKGVVWTDEAAKAMGVSALPVMTVIEDHATSPDSEGRRGYSESIKRSASQMECFAQVIMAKGLKGAAHRAITSTIYAVARQPSRIKVFGGVEGACEWITGLSSVCTVSADVLLTFVNSVRRA